MLKKKARIELSNEEYRIILYALNDLNSTLIHENKDASIVNETMEKLERKMKTDRFVLGIIINALDKKRKNEISKGQDTEKIDYLILRLLKIYESLK